MNAMSNPNFMQDVHRQRSDTMSGARRRLGIVGHRRTVAAPGAMPTFPARPGSTGDIERASAGVA